jgi:hypothetical protein
VSRQVLNRKVAHVEKVILTTTKFDHIPIMFPAEFETHGENETKK